MDTHNPIIQISQQQMNDRINKAFAPLDAYIDGLITHLELEKEKMKSYKNYKYRNLKK